MNVSSNNSQTVQKTDSEQVSENKNTTQNGVTKEQMNWAMAAHLGAVAGFLFPGANIITPLVIWLMKKEEMPFVAQEALTALNFQITITIGLLIGSVLAIIGIGFLIVMALSVANVIFAILAAIQVQKGQPYTYPYSLKLVK